MTTPDVAVVGGGLMGRLLAWRAARSGLSVALYDAASSQGEESAAWVAAGMICPGAESIDVDPEIVSMGRRSLVLWPQWIAELPQPIFYCDAGTLLLWHPQESADEAHRLEKTICYRNPAVELRHVDADILREMEPALAPTFSEALYLPDEATVDNRSLLIVLARALEDAGVQCHWKTFVTDRNLPHAGKIVDCRGMGARLEWRQLRGVRGEIVRLFAPDIELRHMLRLISPRHPVYVTPRAGGRLLVGATTIESDDRSPASVRAVFELLSSAYALLPALAEARILEIATQVRPALPDNRPAFLYDRSRGLLRINGLYRHGFLLSPAVVEAALALLTSPNEEELTAQWHCLRPSTLGMRDAALKDTCE